MSQTLQRDEQALEQSLETLLATHGYQRVLDRLVQVARRDHQPMPTARYLMTLTPKEREPFLEAAVTDALPLYEADRVKPGTERELTADLETGDFHEYGSGTDA